MMLKEQGGIPQAALPLAAFRAHLRLPEGVPSGPHEAAEEAALERALRAAIAAIEARSGKALIARTFELQLTRWRDAQAQLLPVAPVAQIDTVVLRDAEGVAEPVDPERWRLEPDLHRPALVASAMLLPQIPRGSRAEIVFQAGFGAGWDDLPADLAQAVMMLAAQYWEERHAGASHAAGPGAAVPFGLAALVDRWRVPRGFGIGGRAGR